METTTVDLTLADLIHYARVEKSIALPEFQRGYEWGSDARDGSDRLADAHFLVSVDRLRRECETRAELRDVQRDIATQAAKPRAQLPAPGAAARGSVELMIAVQRATGNAAAVRAARMLARQRSPATPPSTGTTVRRARSISEYVDLIRAAEGRLIAAGVTSVDERIQILSGIYYGTDWGLDYEVERSGVRNAAFQIYTARIGPGRDPRPVIGTLLFEALKRSQDVPHPTLGRVDVGHMIIGLNARASWSARVPNIPSQGATGLEIVTWVGDLGGAAAQLARRRLTAPSTPARSFFTGRRGTDYGADSNLEGDIAAYVAGSPSGAAAAPTLTVPPGGGIADALAAYFAAGGRMADRSRAFLQMLGGSFSGSTLTNRADIELLTATKFRDFGRWYAGQRFGPAVLQAIRPLLGAAARDVAAEFMQWLLRRGVTAGSAAAPLGPAATPPPDVFDWTVEGIDWLRRQL